MKRPSLIVEAMEADGAHLAGILGRIATRDGPAGRVVARAFLGARNWGTRDDAVQALGRVGTAADLEFVLPRLTDRAWCVRASAAGSAAEIGSTDAVPVLLARYGRERHAVVRGYIAVAIADLLGGESVPLLEGFLRSEQAPQALLRIYAALVENGREEYLGCFLAYMREDDLRLAVNAAENAPDFATAANIDAIRAALQEATGHERQAVRLSAQRALKRLAR